MLPDVPGHRSRVRAVPFFVLLLSLVSSFHAALAQEADARSFFEQGNAAMRRGDAAEAITDFQRFTKAEPGSAIGYFNLGLALEQGGHLEDALAALRKAGSLDASLRGVPLFSGIVLYKLNRLSEANTALLRATQLEPKNAMAWMWLGVVQLDLNRADAAAASLDKAAALDPTNADILYHRGRAHLLVSKESYAAMYARDPDSWRVHEVLGQSDAEAYRTEDAIGEFRLALRAAPQEPGVHEELGDALWTDGKMQDADDAYAAEIKIDPANAVALYKLGSLRITRDQAAEGVPLLEKALSEDPTLTDAHYYLGRGKAALGQQQDAIQQFRMALAGKGDEELQMMSWYQLATLYRQMHRSADAAEALAAFRKMKDTRDRRQQGKFEAQGRRRSQLPQEEKIPADSSTPPQ
jgi:tetratricopeptide (TPR) repeat protein